ncbi:MAG: alcohol dehydrogenase, partial [Actinomycetota bacterium]|nr:alcohol dehydrogenase [Actinomycetota bacterium]
GGVAETQEMLDFCASHGLGADVEVVSAAEIDGAWRRLLRGDVRYRFVVDAATF